MYFHIICQRRAFVVRELVRRAGFSPNEIPGALSTVMVRPGSD